LKKPVLLSEIRDEVDQLMQTDPGFDRHPALQSAARRLQEQMSIS
jgi:hypothetical protein